MPPVHPAARPVVHAVGPGGLEVSSPPGAEDVVLDVLFDDRRIWSFWVLRDSEPVPSGTEDGGPADERRHVAWPRPLQRFLDGTTRLVVRGHVDEVPLFDDEVAFGSSTERVAVVDGQGQPLGLDKYGRLQATFQNRTREQTAPLLDSLELVLHALQRAGVDAFPAYGTLLGAVRDGALIGHDSDVDLGYLSRHTHPADVVLESFELQRRLAREGFRIVRYSGAAFKVLVTEADGSLRGLDVFSGFMCDGHLVLMGEIRVPFRPEWVVPLGTTTLEGRTLPAPADPDRLLTATYGPGWRVPDPAFHFETPRSTSDRLDDWFRGTNVQRPDWDRHYQSKRRHRPVMRPSPLARYVHRQEQAAAPDLVVDVGCGRGTDARWLARHGLPALGLDYSFRSYEYVAEEARAAGWPLEFRAVNLLELRQALGHGARIAARPGRRVVLARHLLDVLTPRGRRNFWRLARLVATDGGRTYLDALSSDPDGDRWAERRMLQRVDPEQLRAEAEEAGGRVVSAEEIGARGMGASAWPEDPAADRRRACRMVVSWE